MSTIALIQIGYQHFAIPVENLSEVLRAFDSFRRVSSRYDSPGGYVYWYDSGEASELSVTVVPAARIHATEPGKAPPQPVAVKQPKTDERLVTAPSDADPISIRSVPPMRDFVDGYRDGEGAIEAEAT